MEKNHQQAAQFNLNYNQATKAINQSLTVDDDGNHQNKLKEKKAQSQSQTKTQSQYYSQTKSQIGINKVQVQHIKNDNLVKMKEPSESKEGSQSTTNAIDQTLTQTTTKMKQNKLENKQLIQIDHTDQFIIGVDQNQTSNKDKQSQLQEKNKQTQNLDQNSQSFLKAQQKKDEIKPQSSDVLAQLINDKQSQLKDKEKETQNFAQNSQPLMKAQQKRNEINPLPQPSDVPAQSINKQSNKDIITTEIQTVSVISAMQRCTALKDNLISKYAQKTKDIQQIFQMIIPIIQDQDSLQNLSQQQFYQVRNLVLEQYSKVQKITEYDLTKNSINHFCQIFKLVKKSFFIEVAQLIKQKVEQFKPKVISSDPPELKFFLMKKTTFLAKAQNQIDSYFLKNFKEACKYYKMCAGSYNNKLKQPQIYTILNNNNKADKLTQNDLKFVIQIYKRIKDPQKLDLKSFISKEDINNIKKIDIQIFQSLNKISTIEKSQDLQNLFIQEKCFTFKSLKFEIDETIKESQFKSCVKELQEKYPNIQMNRTNISWIYKQKILDPEISLAQQIDNSQQRIKIQIVRNYTIILHFEGQTINQIFKGTQKIENIILRAENISHKSIEQINFSNNLLKGKNHQSLIEEVLQDISIFQSNILLKKILKILVNSEIRQIFYSNEQTDQLIQKKLNISNPSNYILIKKNGLIWKNNNSLNEQQLVLIEKMDVESIKAFLSSISFEKLQLDYSDFIKVYGEQIDKEGLTYFDWIYLSQTNNLRSNVRFMQFLIKLNKKGLDIKTFLILALESYPDFKDELIIFCLKCGIPIPYIYKFIQKKQIISKCSLGSFQAIRIVDTFNLISIGGNSKIGKSKLLKKIFDLNFVVNRQGAINGGIDVIANYKTILQDIKCNVFDVHDNVYSQKEELEYLISSLNQEKIIFLVHCLPTTDLDHIINFIRKFKYLQIIILYRDAKDINYLVNSQKNQFVKFQVPFIQEESVQFAKGLSDLRDGLINTISKTRLKYINLQVQKLPSLDQNNSVDDLPSYNYFMSIKNTLLLSKVKGSFNNNYLEILQDLLHIITQKSFNIYSPLFTNCIKKFFSLKDFNALKTFFFVLSQKKLEREWYIPKSVSISEFKNEYANYVMRGNRIQILTDNHVLEPDFLQIFKKINNIKPFIVSIVGSQSTGKSTLMNILFGSQYKTQVSGCTKGVYFSLFPTAYGKYVGVLDTQGVLSASERDPQFDKKIIVLSFAMSNVVIINIKGQLNANIKQLISISLFGLTRLFGNNQNESSVSNKMHKPKIIFILRDQTDLDVTKQLSNINLLTIQLSDICKLFDVTLQKTIHYQNEKSFVLLEAAFTQKKLISQMFITNVNKNLKPKIFNSQQGSINTYEQWYQIFMKAWKDIEIFKEFYMVKNLVQIHQQKLIKAICSKFRQFYIEGNQSGKQIKPTSQQIISIVNLIQKPEIQTISKQFADKLNQIRQHGPLKDIDIELFENELNTKIVQSFKNSINQLEENYNNQNAKVENKNQKGNLVSMLRQAFESPLILLIKQSISSNIFKLKIQNNKISQEKQEINLEDKILEIKQKIMNKAIEQDFVESTNFYLEKYDQLIEEKKKQLSQNKIQMKPDQETRQIFKICTYLLQKQEKFYTTNAISIAEAQYGKVLEQMKKKLTPLIEDLTESEKIQKGPQIIKEIMSQKIIQISTLCKLNETSSVFQFQIPQDVQKFNSLNTQIQEKLIEFSHSIEENIQLRYIVVQNFVNNQIKMLFKSISSKKKTANSFGQHLIKPFIIYYRCYLQSLIQVQKGNKIQQFNTYTDKYRLELKIFLEKGQIDRNTAQQIATKLHTFFKKYTQQKTSQQFLNKLKDDTSFEVQKLSDDCEKQYFENGTANQIQQYLQNPQVMIKKVFDKKFNEQYQNAIEWLNYAENQLFFTEPKQSITRLLSKLIQIFGEKHQDAFTNYLKTNPLLIQDKNIQFFKMYLQQSQGTKQKLQYISGVIQSQAINFVENSKQLEIFKKYNMNLSSIIAHQKIYSPPKFFKILRELYLKKIEDIKGIEPYVPKLQFAKVTQLKNTNFQTSKGCLSQCFYCKAKCNESDPNHKYHSTKKHRYVAFNAVNKVKKDKKAYFEFYACNSVFNIKNNLYADLEAQNGKTSIFSQDLKQLRKKYNLKQGKVTLSLKWEVNDDLDLHCICPCGYNQQISFRNKKCSKCNQTQLDWDMLSLNQQGKAIENIYFKKQQYKDHRIKCWVHAFSKNANEPNKFLLWITKKNQQGKQVFFQERKGVLKKNKEIWNTAQIDIDIEPQQIKSIPFLQYNDKYHKDKMWVYLVDYNQYDLNIIWKGWRKISSKWQQKFGVLDDTQGIMPNQL